MAVQSQLLRRRRKQDQSRRGLGQRFDEAIAGAGAVDMPFEVMRLIHDHQVPACRLQLRGALAIAGEPVGAGDHQLLFLERIALGRFRRDGFAALLVEDGETEVEAA